MERTYKRRRLSGGSIPDGDLNERRAQNDLRLKSIFESIFNKYGKDFEGIADEIDLETGEIVVNNGHILGMTDERDAGEVEAWSEELEIEHSSEDESGDQHTAANCLGEYLRVSEPLHTRASICSDFDADSLMGDALVEAPTIKMRKTAVKKFALPIDDEQDELASSDFERISPRKARLYIQHSRSPQNDEPLPSDDQAVEPLWRAPPLPSNETARKEATTVANGLGSPGSSNYGSPLTSIWAPECRKRLVPKTRKSGGNGDDPAEIFDSGDSEYTSHNVPWTLAEEGLLRRMKTTTKITCEEMKKYFPLRSRLAIASHWSNMVFREKEDSETDQSVRSNRRPRYSFPANIVLRENANNDYDELNYGPGDASEVSLTAEQQANIIAPGATMAVYSSNKPVDLPSYGTRSEHEQNASSNQAQDSTEVGEASLIAGQSLTQTGEALREQLTQFGASDRETEPSVNRALNNARRLKKSSDVHDLNGKQSTCSEKSLEYTCPSDTIEGKTEQSNSSTLFSHHAKTPADCRVCSDGPQGGPNERHTYFQKSKIITIQHKELPTEQSVKADSPPPARALVSLYDHSSRTIPLDAFVVESPRISQKYATSHAASQQKHGNPLSPKGPFPDRPPTVPRPMVQRGKEGCTSVNSIKNTSSDYPEINLDAAVNNMRVSLAASTALLLDTDPKECTRTPPSTRLSPAAVDNPGNNLSISPPDLPKEYTGDDALDQGPNTSASATVVSPSHGATYFVLEQSCKPTSVFPINPLTIQVVIPSPRADHPSRKGKGGKGSSPNTRTVTSPSAIPNTQITTPSILPSFDARIQYGPISPTLSEIDDEPSALNSPSISRPADTADSECPLLSPLLVVSNAEESASKRSPIRSSSVTADSEHPAFTPELVKKSEPPLGIEIADSQPENNPPAVSPLSMKETVVQTRPPGKPRKRVKKAVKPAIAKSFSSIPAAMLDCSDDELSFL